MPIKLNDTYLAQGACRTEAAAFLPLLRDADEKIRNKSGAGSDYVGWIDLPVDYDRVRAKFIRYLVVGSFPEEISVHLGNLCPFFHN